MLSERCGEGVGELIDSECGFLPEVVKYSFALK